MLGGDWSSGWWALLWWHSSVLWEVGGLSTWVARWWCGLWAVGLLAGLETWLGWGLVLAPRALQGTTVDVIATELADSHGGILVGVHLDESKAAVRLKASLNNVTEVLEERNKIVLGGVWGKVSDVTGSLPLWSLLDDHVVALNSVGWKVVVTEWSGWSQSSGGHHLLLGDGWLPLLVGPVAANSTRTEPLTVHGAQRLLGILALTESNESVSTGTSSLHIPHNSSLRNGTEGRESLEKNLIVDLVGKIANEDMKVVRSILLVGSVRLVCPVDADLSLVDTSAVQSLHGALRRSWVIVLNEAVVESLGL